MALASPASGEPTLAEVRTATERFRNVNVALAEGYIRDPFDLCDTAEMMGKPAHLGAMGIHYFRPDLVGVSAPPNPRVDGNGTHTDFLKPSILIYEPQKDGSLELVAVENLVFLKAWEASGAKDRPELPRRAVGQDGGQSGDRNRRSAHVRAALRPACMALSRQSERRVHALQSVGELPVSHRGEETRDAGADCVD